MTEYVATWERDWERKVEESGRTTRKAIAKSMYDDGVPLDFISRHTGLSAKQIKELVQAQRPH